MLDTNRTLSTQKRHLNTPKKPTLDDAIATDIAINIIAIQCLKFFLKKLSKNVATCLTLTDRSFFVVATNDVERKWKATELLKQYKSQNRVERGFRFLKDPEFFADSIFVSKNEHIQALLMIMTLGLAVFSGLEWKLRNAMKESNVQLPNQTGKLTDKITMRYVFQIFSTVITIVLDNGERLFYHISEQANRILELLGDKYQKTYGS